MPEGKVRAEIDGALQLDYGLIEAPSQVKRAAHGPVHRRVALVGHDPLRRGFAGLVHFRLGQPPSLKSVLKMREGESGIGARECGVERDRHLEKMTGLLIVGLAIPVHVPQAAMVRLPRNRASSAA